MEEFVYNKFNYFVCAISLSDGVEKVREQKVINNFMRHYQEWKFNFWQSPFILVIDEENLHDSLFKTQLEARKKDFGILCLTEVQKKKILTFCGHRVRVVVCKNLKDCRRHARLLTLPNDEMCDGKVHLCVNCHKSVSTKLFFPCQHLCICSECHDLIANIASSSLHDTITVNLTLVQCEFHTSKKLSLQESYQLIGI